MWRSALVLLLIVQLATASSTVHVSDGRSLVAAITNSAVSNITLDNDVRLSSGDWPDGVYRLNRNLTIQSDPHGRHLVIDFDARTVQRKLAISAGYNLSLIHLTLKDTRYGAGADIDLLAPSPNGILYLHDLAKLQYSCAPLVQKNILAYPRDATVPGVNDILFPKTVLWDGDLYNDTIYYRDFSTRMTVGENVAYGGYVVHKRGSWKFCEHIVNPQCVAAADADSCIKQEMDAAYAGLHPGGATRGLSPAAIAGIVVAVVVAAIAAAAATVFCIMRRRRLQQQLLPVHEKHGAGENGATAASGGKGSVLKHSAGGKGPGLLAVLSPDQGGAATAAGSAAAVSPDAYRGQPGSSNASVSSFRIMVGHVGTAASVSTFESRSSCETVNSGASNVQQQAGSAGEAGHGPGHMSGTLGGLASPARVGALAMPDIVRSTMSREEASSILLGRMVGAGSFGRVFQGLLRGEEVAIKVIHHNSRAAAQVSTEVELMMTFNHPNLVRAHHYVTWAMSGVSLRMSRPGACDISPRSGHDQQPSSGSPSQTGSSNIVSSGSNTAKMMETWIITAFCNAGNLQDAAMAHNEGGFFAQDVPRLGVVLNVLLGVARGMDWLHEQHVLHGDLKAANVLLSLVPGGSDHPQADGRAIDQSGMQLLAQVADFGLSRVIMEGATHLSTFTVGTITHQPPELMRSGRLSKPADVFSFGVLMWEVITGDQPWKGRMMGEIMTMVMIEGARLEFPSTVPRAYADLARRCWLEDPAARPSFGELVRELEELLQQAPALQEAAAAAVRAHATAPPPVELSAAAAWHVCGSGGEGGGLNEEDEEQGDDLYKTMSSTSGAAGGGAVQAGVSSCSSKDSKVEDVWAGEEI